MTAIGQSWGRLQPPHSGPVALRRSRHDGPVAASPPLLAWGNGRSYGDVCCNTAGTLIDGRGADHVLALDTAAGRLRCESGILLRDLQRMLVPRGWFLPVVPGTELVTIGGAVANDVHGKNHHQAGSFGHHVRRLVLLRGDGERIECGPEERADWFRATVGGLGLTGLITEVEVALKPLAGGGWLTERAWRTGTLAETLARLSEADSRHEYTAAWLDCLARGRRLGRGVVFAGDHAQGIAPPPPESGSGPGVPFALPVSPVRPLSLRAFNALYYRLRRADSGWRARWYRPALHPLDRIGRWNRLYGRAGFAQCQVALPEEGHAAALAGLIDLTARHREGSFLVVLKRLGAAEPPGLLSFARPGYTLALDFPWRGERTRALVRELYDIALAAGGAVYPAKDAVMTPEQFARSFPASAAFRAFRDPAFDSDFARRVELS